MKKIIIISIFLFGMNNLWADVQTRLQKCAALTKLLRRSMGNQPGPTPAPAPNAARSHREIMDRVLFNLTDSKRDQYRIASAIFDIDRALEDNIDMLNREIQDALDYPRSVTDAQYNDVIRRINNNILLQVGVNYIFEKYINHRLDRIDAKWLRVKMLRLFDLMFPQAAAPKATEPKAATSKETPLEFDPLTAECCICNELIQGLMNAGTVINRSTCGRGHAYICDPCLNNFRRSGAINRCPLCRAVPFSVNPFN